MYTTSYSVGPPLVCSLHSRCEPRPTGVNSGSTYQMGTQPYKLDMNGVPTDQMGTETLQTRYERRP